ncbi:hypothetical protein [Virgibacillus ihumii]|uniref:hypothetical protein n=1 Tax=Virgibacillus ihumii TaxID=2686091 RepID=UPI00157D1966|nr:hypothetical protein [Virgibacillus ihumii]
MSQEDERGSLVEQDPQKRMFKKLIFLSVIASLVVVMYVWKWTDKPENQSPEEMFETSQAAQQSQQQTTGLNEERINAALKDDGTPNKQNEQQETEKTSSNTHNLEEKYQQQYGKQTVSKAKEQAKTGLALYLLQKSDWDKWEGIVTDSFLEKVKADIQALENKYVERKLEKVDLFASQYPEDNHMSFGAFATWHVTVDGQTTSNPMQLYYITLQPHDGKWLVSNIVTPNQKGMEGTGRKETS